MAVCFEDIWILEGVGVGVVQVMRDMHVLTLPEHITLRFLIPRSENKVLLGDFETPRRGIQAQDLDVAALEQRTVRA